MPGTGTYRPVKDAVCYETRGIPSTRGFVQYQPPYNLAKVRARQLTCTAHFVRCWEVDLRGGGLTLLSSFPSALPSFPSPSSTLAAVLRTAHLTGVVVVRGKMKREGLTSPSLPVHAQPPSLPLVPWFACAGPLTPGSCSPSLPLHPPLLQPGPLAVYASARSCWHSVVYAGARSRSRWRSVTCACACTCWLSVVYARSCWLLLIPLFVGARPHSCSPLAVVPVVTI